MKDLVALSPDVDLNTTSSNTATSVSLMSNFTSASFATFFTTTLTRIVSSFFINSVESDEPDSSRMSLNASIVQLSYTTFSSFSLPFVTAKSYLAFLDALNLYQNVCFSPVALNAAGEAVISVGFTVVTLTFAVSFLLSWFSLSLTLKTMFL